MEKKKRRYEIHSMVLVPDIEEIQKAAADFTDESQIENYESEMKKSARFPTVDPRPQFDAELSTIKKEMQKLAIAIANEEKIKDDQKETAELSSADQFEDIATLAKPESVPEVTDVTEEKTTKKSKKSPPKK